MSTLIHGNVRLAYEVQGSTGAPVLFIQGVGVAGCGWRPQVEGLAPRYRTLTFDNRGIGGSTLAKRSPFTVEQLADDAAALMDAVGWQTAHVVGHSLGGVIAQRLALKYHSRVRSLTLMCTVARGRDATRLTGRMLVLGLRTRIGSRAMRRQAFLDMVFPSDYLATQDRTALANAMGPLFGRDVADSPPIVMQQLAALRAHDCSAELHALANVPTLVMSAAHDPIAPPLFGKALAQAIPQARYVEYGNASHALPIQLAAEVNDALHAHFAQAT